MDAFDVGVLVEEGLRFGFAAGKHECHSCYSSAHQFREAAVEPFDQPVHMRLGRRRADEHHVVERGDDHPAIEKMVMHGHVDRPVDHLRSLAAVPGPLWSAHELHPGPGTHDVPRHAMFDDDIGNPLLEPLRQRLEGTERLLV